MMMRVARASCKGAEIVSWPCGEGEKLYCSSVHAVTGLGTLMHSHAADQMVPSSDERCSAERRSDPGFLLHSPATNQTDDDQVLLTEMRLICSTPCVNSE